MNLHPSKGKFLDNIGNALHANNFIARTWKLHPTFANFLGNNGNALTSKKEFLVLLEIGLNQQRNFLIKVKMSSTYDKIPFWGQG